MNLNNMVNQAIIEIAVIIISIITCNHLLKLVNTVLTSRLNRIDNELSKKLLENYKLLLNEYNESRKYNRIMSIYCLSHIYNIELENENYDKCKELVKLIEELQKEDKLEQN
jgi:hypothetical protein